MNTNNKEALKLLRKEQNGYQPHTYTWNRLEQIIDLLQNNEDTEVQDIAVKDEHTCSNRSECCPKCCAVDHKPSSKVEKLKELQEEIGGGGYGKDYIHPMCDLIDILLIEDK